MTAIGATPRHASWKRRRRLRSRVPADGSGLLPFLSQLGHVLIASGEAVAVIEDLLRRIARAHGVPRVSVVAFPTVLFVKLDDGHAARLDFTSEEGLTLRFDQIESAFALARTPRH